MALKDKTLDELLSLDAAVKKAITQKQEEEKINARKEIHEIAGRLGISVENLIQQIEPKKRKPAVVRYRHPTIPELTWVGRGPQPKWITKALAAGLTIQDLEVPPLKKNETD